MNGFKWLKMVVLLSSKCPSEIYHGVISYSLCAYLLRSKVLNGRMWNTAHLYADLKRDGENLLVCVIVYLLEYFI